MTRNDFNYSVTSAAQQLNYHALKFTKDGNDAQDLVQDTLVKALVNREKFKPGTNIKAWLYIIMRNTFIGNYHKKAHRKTILDTADEYSLIDLSDSVTENRGEGSFVMEDVIKSVESLNEMFKTPFLLYYRGFKYHEIADKLEVPIGTVKNRIHIARKRLKSKLGDYQVTN